MTAGVDGRSAKRRLPVRLCLVGLVVLATVVTCAALLRRGLVRYDGTTTAGVTAAASRRPPSTGQQRKRLNIAAHNRRDQHSLPPRKLPSRGEGAQLRGRQMSNRQHRLPDVIIFGSKKSGTKSLITFLGAHSKIAAAEQEVHFFDHNFHLGLEVYRSMMPLSTDGQLTVEKTPGYFQSSEIPLRIKGSLPSTVKLIVVLREPVTRAISDYTHFVSRFSAVKKLPKTGAIPSLETLIYKNDTRELNSLSKIVLLSSYAQLLRPWYDTFGRDRIHVVDGETFIKQPWIEMREIQRFLGLPIELTKESFRFNKTKGFYCVAKRKRRPLTKNDLICLASNKGRRHLPIKASTRRDLEVYYEERERELETLLQRKLSWMK